MNRYKYILATFAAAITALAVWLFMPIRYSATTTISDEYKEMDLAIGLHIVNAQIRDMTGGANKGMNDMELYCKILKTEDVAKDLSHISIPGSRMNYGEYLGEKDTLNSILDNIEYNFSSRRSTLTISFTDRNALVASQLLDSLTYILQEKISKYRYTIIDSAVKHAEKEHQLAKIDYEQAKKRYADYTDAQSNISTQIVFQEKDRLKQELELAKRHLSNTNSEYTRQVALKQRVFKSFAVVKCNTVPLKDNRNFLLYFCTLTILFILAVKGITLYHNQSKSIWKRDLGDFFSPWSLTIFIWGADIILYFLQGTMDPIGPKFIQCFSVWILTLMPASLATYWLTQKDADNHIIDYRKPIETPRILFHSLCILAGLLTLVYAMRVWSVVSQFELDNLLYNLRTYIIEDNSVTGLLNHVQGLNFALFVIGLWMYPKISKIELTYIVIVNLVFEIFRMEKSGILIMILGTMFVLYERRHIKIRSILFSFAGIILLFFFFNLSKEDVNSETESTFLDFFGMYVTSPMVAFDHLYPDLSGNFGQNTFCILYPYFNMLGFNLDYMDRLQEFVWVPIPTNVYTIMQPFYNDFGISGIGFFGLLYGVLFGWTYRRFREGNPVYICIYTYLVEVIIIQFYNDNLLQNIVLFIEFCFFVFILTQEKFKLAFNRS